MCGIAGYVGALKLPDERIEGCLARMGRRGPDHRAARHLVTPDGRQVHLLHSRLSIIDLDPRAHQPFPVGRRWGIFNGELYNYLELKQRLSEQGETFTTQSDTEVLLKALDRQGWEALDRCEGMWAFALYDETDGSLSLCRDRFGEKPLYVFRDEGGLYFGSECKFIFALLGRRLPIDADHLHRYLVNGYKSLYKKPRSFFQGMEEVAAGERWQVEAGAPPRRTRYWQPGFATEPDMTFEDAVTGARQRLVRAVEMRLRADVPLAFCMSGGVDSNALISIAKNVFGYDVHGFTIVNTDARYEEQDMVEHAVAELGIRHTAIPVDTSGFLPKLRRLVAQHDAPVYTITYYAHWLLMESIARQGYRISISGTAADELFSGYYDHQLAYLYAIRDSGAPYKNALRAWTEHIRPIVRNPFLSNPHLFIEQPDFRGHIYLDAEEFSGILTRPWSEPFEEAPFTGELLRNRMANEMFHENVPVILHDDDLNAMYYSIENRSPFLDRELFDFCFRIPTAHLIRDGRAKAILREAVRGIAPTRIVDNRRKVGFNAPIFSFLDVTSAEVRAEVLADSPIFEHVKRERIEALMNRPDLPNSESKFLFYFLSAKMFLEEFAS
jgi:asparagine synthase (glutamine-hydrolysing)